MNLSCCQTLAHGGATASALAHTDEPVPRLVYQSLPSRIVAWIGPRGLFNQRVSQLLFVSIPGGTCSHQRVRQCLPVSTLADDLVLQRSSDLVVAS
jgi:hypothetical protein